MNGQYSPNEEKFLDGIRGALSGEEVHDLPVPTSDDEKHLDDILKAAQGEEPLYNLPANWNHQKRLIAIKEAIQEGGGGSVPEYAGPYTVTPSESAQTLDCGGKKMTDDVTVGAISSKYIGSGVTQKAAATYTPTTSDQTIAADQYLAGAQTVKGDANLVSGNIKKDTQIFGVTGTYEGSGGGGDWVEPTGDPALKLYVEIPFDNLDVSLYVGVLYASNASGSVDWGDGSSTEALDNGVSLNNAGKSTRAPKTHTYQSKGKYVVACYCSNSYLVKLDDSTTTKHPSIITTGKYLGSVSSSIYSVNALPLLRKVYIKDNYLYPAGTKDHFNTETLLTDFDGYVPGGATTNYNPKNMFSGSAIKNTRIQGGVIIGDYAYYYCKFLERVSIGNTITKIGSYAFSGCVALKTIIFNSVTPPEVSNSNTFDVNPSCHIEIPYNSVAYLTATNYPSPSTYTYIGFGTFADGATLKTEDATASYALTWYATKEDAIAQTNPITVGNGNEIYCRYTAV